MVSPKSIQTPLTISSSHPKQSEEQMLHLNCPVPHLASLTLRALNRLTRGRGKRLEHAIEPTRNRRNPSVGCRSLGVGKAIVCCTEGLPRTI